MKAQRRVNELPPGFILVPSRSRPGECSYWSQALGQKFGSLDLAWIAYERLISSKRDTQITVSETVEPIKEMKSSPRAVVGSSSSVVEVKTSASWKGSNAIKGQEKPPQVPQRNEMHFPHSRHLPPISEESLTPRRHRDSNAAVVEKGKESELALFTDSSFPPKGSSIGVTNEEDRTSRLRISMQDRDEAIWIRLPDFIRKVNGLESSDAIQLFGNIEPHDLTQGVVGDCWLLATMACLAEFPNAIESLFCGTSEASPDGMYTIKLFDLDKRDWVYLTIDDYIPCRYENDYSNVPFRMRSDGVKVYNAAVSPTKKLKPLFAIPNGNQMWAALLEKAVAKFVGTYAQIAGGHEPFAMIAFTGFPQVYQYKRVPTNDAKTEAKVGEWERGWAQWAGRTSPSCGYRPTLEKLTFRNDEFFPKLLEYDRLNYMMAASIVCYAPPKTGDEFIRPDGLVLGHAYSLLAVEDFGTVRLVKLRNPHGRGSPEHPTEWNGRWSDASPEWDSHPDINNSVGHERVLHDGIFWMEYSDFVSVFDKVLILPYPMSQPRGALSSIRRAKLRASMRSVARASKDVAGIALEDLTHIDQVVTAIHLMSIKPYDPYLNAPDWVKEDETTLNRWAQEKLGIKPPNSS